LLDLRHFPAHLDVQLDRIGPRGPLVDRCLLLGLQPLLRQPRELRDLLRPLQRGQLGAVQILRNAPEPRLDVVEVGDADGNALLANDAESFEPVSAGDQ
jgi:hypothetical protein